MNDKVRQRIATTIYGVVFAVIGGVLYLLDAGPALDGIGTVLAFVGVVVFVIGLIGIALGLTRGSESTSA